MPLEKADISKLRGDGLEAADADHGEGRATARPTSTACCSRRRTSTRRRKYPIINHVYPGPADRQRRAAAPFTAARGDRQALAELGFVVVTIDGMGTPGRSKSFHDAYYGAMGRDNTIPDQVAGMKELAQQYPCIDIDRAGIWGHSGGGFATATAMFRYPGLLQGRHRRVRQPRPARLRGRLGRALPGPAREERRTAPTTTRPRPTRTSRRTSRASCCSRTARWTTTCRRTTRTLVVDALIKANKDFDLLMLPNAGPRLRRRRRTT